MYGFPARASVLPVDTLREALEKINIDAYLDENVPMSGRTTFRIGGPADLVAKPRSLDGLRSLMAFCAERGISPFILGGGSNILVSDAGLRGIVVDMGGLSGLRRENSKWSDLSGTELLVAQAGLDMDALAEAALDLGLSGMEWAAGLPGTVGGAVYMNARCYDVEIADILHWTQVLKGTDLDVIPFEASDFSYKRSPFQPGCPRGSALIVAAAFRLEPGDREAIRARMEEHRADRTRKGHYRMPCAGSVFKNDRAFGEPSGAILDRLGFRGRRRGGAAVSDWHANIFINAGGASAADMAALMEEARAEALARTGFALEPEIIRVGEFPKEST